MDTIKRLKTRAEAWQKATGLRDAFNGSVAILNVYTLHYSDVILMKFAEKDRNKIPYKHVGYFGLFILKSMLYNATFCDSFIERPSKNYWSPNLYPAQIKRRLFLSWLDVQCSQN